MFSRKAGGSMAVLMTIAITVALLVAALKFYNCLDSMLSKAEGALGGHVLKTRQRVTAGLGNAAKYLRPRAANWARRLVLGSVAHLVVFFGAAAVVAVVRPAPQQLAYELVAQSPDASFWERNTAYVSIGSGWGVKDVRPGFLYSTATLFDGTKLVGLPGFQKWYRL